MDLTLKSASMLHFLHHTVFNMSKNHSVFFMNCEWTLFSWGGEPKIGWELWHVNGDSWQGINVGGGGGSLFEIGLSPWGLVNQRSFAGTIFFLRWTNQIYTIIRHLLLYFIKFYYLMAFVSFELIQLVWFSCWEQSNVVTIWLCHKMWFVRVDLQASACKGFLKIPKLIYFYHPYVKFKWLAPNFSIWYHPWMTLQGHKNKGNDHQLKELLIVKQILLVSTLGNV